MFLRIPAPAAWLNANSRTDRRSQTDDRQEWRRAGRVYALQAHLPRGLKAIHVIATIHPTNRIRRDVANLYPTVKALVDGLVDYGLIPDDNDRHLLGPDMRPGAVVPKSDFPGGGLVVLSIRELPGPLEPVALLEVRRELTRARIGGAE